MFGEKNKKDQIEQGVQVVNELVQALLKVNETLIRIEKKIDVIYTAYADLNQPK